MADVNAGERTRLAVLDVCAAVIDSRNELSRHDAAIGDGDHGASMAKAFKHVRAALEELEEPTPKAVLAATGATLLAVAGGAMGPLLGTAFLDAAAAVPDRARIDAAVVADMLAQADAGVTRLGKADPGDKTMMDALRPAVIAASAAASRGASACEALAAAAHAARLGADSTIGMRALRGRASRLGARSIGHPDPGAVSTALILETMAASVDRSGLGPAVNDVSSELDS